MGWEVRGNLEIGNNIEKAVFTRLILVGGFLWNKYHNCLKHDMQVKDKIAQFSSRQILKYIFVYFPQIFDRPPIFGYFIKDVWL